MSSADNSRIDAGHKPTISRPHKPKRKATPADLLPNDQAARVVADVARSGEIPPGDTLARLTEDWQEACYSASQQGAAGLESWLFQIAGRSKPDTIEAMRAALSEALAEVDASAKPLEPPMPTDEELGLLKIGDIQEKELEWLWPGRIPRGKITLLAGQGGLGKTYLTLDIVARVTRGRPFPDTPHIIPTPADAIFLTAEDDFADTIVPRLKKMGADLDRAWTMMSIRLPNGKLSPFTLAELDRLEWVLKRRPQTKLLVIDPIAAFLGRGVDDGKNAELRAVLGPLAELSAKYGVATVPITHFNKSASASAAARVMGSVAYSNAARATWAVVRDPEKPERRLMLHVKFNLDKDPYGLAYTVVDGAIEWEEEPIFESADDFLAKTTQQGSAGSDVSRREAVAALRSILASGPMRSDDVFKQCQALGIGENRVWKAKKEAGVKAEKVSFGSEGYWLWRLKDPTTPGDFD